MAVWKLWGLVLVLAWAAVGCARGGLIQRADSDSRAAAVVVGDGRAAVAGEGVAVPVRAEVFRVGLGHEDGALIFWGGRVWGQDSGGVPVPDVLFAAGIPRRVRPTARYDFKAGGAGWTLAELYEELAELHGEQFVVAGVGMVNGWPPYGGESKAPKESAIFVGAVTSRLTGLSRVEKRIFLDDESDGGQLNVRSHTVAARTALCKECDPEAPERVQPEVLDVRRVSAQSRIRRARLVVYAVENWEAQ